MCCNFQPQFNQLSFQVIGDDPAPSYFTVATNGFNLNQADVRVSSNLANGNQDRYYVSTLYISSLYFNTPTFICVDVLLGFCQRDISRVTYF